ncbi:MAG: MgtC/SapB family protein [Thermoguttaceae bacterium]
MTNQFFEPLIGDGDLSLATITFRVFFALCVGGVLGIERGLRNRPAGFMTYMLVTIGSTIFMLTNQYIQQMEPNVDMTRFGAQVISGIGFLGAGTIIVTRQNEVRGLTTAAGLWVAAALGLAIGAGFYEGAVVGTTFVAFALVVLKKFDLYIKRHSKNMEIYLEYNAAFSLRALTDFIKKEGCEATEMQRGKITTLNNELGTLTFLLHLERRRDHMLILNELDALEGVEYVKEIA